MPKKVDGLGVKCPRCNKGKANIHRIYGVLYCDKCQDADSKLVSLKHPPEFATIAQSNRITTDRDHHSKDTIQPWDKDGKPNVDFIKNYPDKVGDYFEGENLNRL